MKILVTGGAGFIGSHLCDHLVKDEHEVFVIDNLSLGEEKNICHLMKLSNFNFIKGDILDLDLVNSLFELNNFEMVFHFAANSDIAQSYQNPDIDKDNTFMTTYNILKMMQKFSVNKIVFASTSAIYGDSSDLLYENYGPLNPVSHYGASKLASEAFISSFVENYNLQAWVVRFPNVVGERATHGVIFDFIKKIKKNKLKLEVLGDGEQFKPYLYVKDLVEAILFVWKNTNEKINIYNLGVNSRTKVKEIAQMVVEEMNIDVQIEYAGGDKGWVGDVPTFNYDLEKINKLGWKSKITSNDAIRKSIKHILQDN